MRCAECQRDVPEEELIYNDDLGSDVCEDCNSNATEEAVEVGDGEEA
jgi:hypothetical protein